jgi:hypothetical protein
MSQVLKGKVALVAGATRGAGRGIAVELGAAGATVYVTGRTTRTERSEVNRPETIEETAELVQHAGGQGIAVQVDHLDPAQVQALVARIEREHRRLDLLVNNVWGADFLIEWNVPVWEHSLEGGLHAAARHRHAYRHQPLRATPLDQESGRTGGRDDGRHGRIQQRKVPSVAVLRPRQDLGHSHGLGAGAGVPAPSVHGPCPDSRLAAVGADAGENYGVSEADWRDATAKQPHFVITETPRYVGRAVAALAADPEAARWSGQSLSSGQLAKVYGFTDLDGSQPDAWRYVREVQDAGKPADATGYR